MRRFRRWRRRVAALGLLPAAVLALTTSVAHAATETAPAAQISVGDSYVPFGRKVALAGSVPGAAAAPVTLQFRSARAEEWSALRRLTTDSEGNYRVVIRARRSGAFQAVPTGGGPSAEVELNVRARASLRSHDSSPLAGAPLTLRGRVRPAGRRAVRVEVGGETLRTTTNGAGRFGVRWTPRRPGVFRARASTGEDELALAGHATSRVTVFRRAAASWYGPGLYGNPLACGGTLVPGMLGVANKTLPCGTKLTLSYGGRSVRVQVIDRGPFGGGREFDLTEATKQRLGFPDVGYVLSSR